MALRTIGWVQQVNDTQFMAIRSATFGGATSFHGKFGDAKGAVESAIGHICRAHKQDGVAPFRWELLDDDGVGGK